MRNLPAEVNETAFSHDQAVETAPLSQDLDECERLIAEALRVVTEDPEEADFRGRWLAEVLPLTDLPRVEPCVRKALEIPFHDQFFEAFLNEWIRRDPEAMIQRLLESGVRASPFSPKLEQVLAFLASRDPDRAFAWLETLRGKRGLNQTELLRGVYFGLVHTHPEEALRHASGMDLMVREQLLQWASRELARTDVLALLRAQRRVGEG